MKLKDAYLEVSEDDLEGGYTENTDINLMRWNLKFEKKIFRIDGIFHSGNSQKIKIKTNKIKLIGNKPIGNIPIYISKKIQEDFIKYRVPGGNSELSKKKLKLIDGEIKLFPSDHFGVIAELEIL